MSRKRDYRAEYRARAARAKAKGFESYGAQRRAAELGKRSGRAPLTPSELRAVKERATRRQIHDTGNGTMVQTTARGKGFGVIEGQLRGHGSNPVRLQITTRDGRRRELYGRGRSASDVLRLMRRDGGGMSGIAAQANAAEELRYSAGNISAEDITDVSVELLEGWPK